MSGLDRRLEEELLRRLPAELRQAAQRRVRRGRRMLVKLVKTFVVLLVSTIVIIVGMIASGLLLGPRGVEGLIAAPLVLLATWSLILYLAFRPRSSPRVVVRSDIKQLPARTEEWLDEQRRGLPAAAEPLFDSIALRLEALSVQVQGLSSDSPGASELRRLLGEELVELVTGYHKVPRALRGQPLHGGDSPDRQLIAGLATVDSALDRLQTRIAGDDMRALATQQRYLEMKYRDGDKLE